MTPFHLSITLKNVSTSLRRIDFPSEPSTASGGRFLSGDPSQPGACGALGGRFAALGGKDRSTWHRIDSEEMWHFYEGDPLHVHVLQPHGALQTFRLGNPLEHDGADFQALVPAGAWFAAECTVQDGHSLMGCTVAPGFEFDAFEIAQAELLLEDWPLHQELIKRLARR